MKTINVRSLAAEMDYAIYYNEDRKAFFLRDGSPEWMTDVILSSSTTSLDTAYDFANRIVSAFAENDDPEDAIYEIEPDIYTHDLTEWLGADVAHVCYLNDILMESEVKDGFQLLAAAQARQIDEVAHAMLDELNSLVETLKDERSDLLLSDTARVRVNGIPRRVLDYNIDDDEILVEFPDPDNEYENDSEWLSPDEVILHDPESDYWPECDNNVYPIPGAPEYA